MNAIPEFDCTDERVVASLMAARFRLSLKAIEVAKTIAWKDLPMNERANYLRMAEEAVMESLKS